MLFFISYEIFIDETFFPIQFIIRIFISYHGRLSYYLITILCRHILNKFGYGKKLAAPVEKLVRVVVIKEIKGSQYGVQLEGSVRDRLAEEDKYEEEEEEALEQVVHFFQSKYFNHHSVITFYFPPTAAQTVEVTILTNTTCYIIICKSEIDVWVIYRLYLQRMEMKNRRWR